MREAIRLANESVKNGGGPFGAVIVKDGEIIAGSSNSVTRDNDPTAHAEVNTIRQACRKLGTFDLSDCLIYTSCEPCPMCLGAILWANIDRVFQGCNISDAEKIGFRDSKFYDFLRGKPGLLTTTELSRDACLKLFEDYSNSSKKKNY